MARTEAELTEGIDDDFKRVIGEMITFFTAMATKFRGRATHTTGAAARGSARVIVSPDFPPNDLFQHGKTYPVVIRHATGGPQHDDRFLDGGSVAIKFYPPGAEARTGEDESGVGIHDLLMNTGRSLFGRTARDFNTMAHAGFIPGKSHGETRRPLIESGVIDDDIMTEAFRTGSFTEFYYHTQICFELIDQTGRMHYVRFRVIPGDRGPERGLFPPSFRAHGETFGLPWTDDKRAADYRRADFEVRVNHLGVNYLLQAQIRPTDDPEAVNGMKVWDEQQFPWVDVAEVHLNQTLTAEEIEALEFNVNRLTGGFNLPLAKTADDHASVGHARALVYWHARKARADALKLPPPEPPKPATPPTPDPWKINAPAQLQQVTGGASGGPVVRTVMPGVNPVAHRVIAGPV